MQMKRVEVADAEKCVGCQCCMFACSRRFGEAGTGKARIHVRSVGGMERGFVVVVCRACESAPCAMVCPTGAIEQRERGVRFISSRCTGCGHCRHACTLGAVFWDDKRNKPMICTYCGYCTRFCPHGVLRMEELS